MLEWPDERRARLARPQGPRTVLADFDPELRGEIRFTPGYDRLVGTVMHAYQTAVPPQEALAELASVVEAAFGDHDEAVRQIALAEACAAVLRGAPSRAVWEYLSGLEYHSSLLEMWLPQVVIAAALDDQEFRAAFLLLAADIVKAAVDNPGRRAFQREKDIAAAFRQDWEERPLLSRLWVPQHLDRALFSIGRDDDGVLLIVAEIDLTAFLALLALYDHPTPVALALSFSPVMRTYDGWHCAVAAAPKAFEASGDWTGSLVFPLLLTLAREELTGVRRGTGEPVTAELKTLAIDIAAAVASRSDAPGAVLRWGAWLVRGLILANPRTDVIDASIPGFADSILIDALLEAPIPIDPASDAAEPLEPWEPWCQLGYRGFVSAERALPFTSATPWLAEWRLTPEDWSSRRGLDLKAHAAPFIQAKTAADDYGGRVLALCLKAQGPADEIFLDLWNNAETLRDILEYGDPDEAADGGWQGRSEAGRLLRLQFSVGLAMLDQVVWPQRTIPKDRVGVAARLVALLDDALREMSAIDPHDRKFWSEAARHLAVRRARWLSVDSGAEVLPLPDTVRPTLADFISRLKGDTDGLLDLAYVLQRNGTVSERIAAAFDQAEVDLGKELRLVDRLRTLSPRLTSISEEQLKAVKAMVPTKPSARRPSKLGGRRGPRA